MRYTVIVCLLFVACSDTETLNKLCYIDPDPCMVDQDQIITRPAVNQYNPTFWGHLECRGDQTICVDYSPIREEECNGLDDDADFEVDEGTDLGVFDLRNDCVDEETCGVCKRSRKECVDGFYFCVPTQTYGEEICDGLDNDCDCVTDNTTSHGNFYWDDETYPPETISWSASSICSVGMTLCEGGEEQILGYQPPLTEICGNDLDDDCDGFVDEWEDEPRSQDFAVLLDESESMDPYVLDIVTSICLWADDNQFVGSRFAFVSFGGGISYVAAAPRLITDFVDAGEACETLLDFELLDGSREYAVEAAMGLHDSNSDINLSWDNDNIKRVIAISDEVLQHLSNVDPDDRLTGAINDCQQNNYSVDIFTNGDHFWSWYGWADGCNGFVDELEEDHYEMIDKFKIRFGGDCG